MGVRLFCPSLNTCIKVLSFWPWCDRGDLIFACLLRRSLFCEWMSFFYFFLFFYLFLLFCTGIFVCFVLNYFDIHDHVMLILMK